MAANIIIFVLLVCTSVLTHMFANIHNSWPLLQVGAHVCGNQSIVSCLFFFFFDTSVLLRPS